MSVRRLNGAEFRGLAEPVLRNGHRLRFQAGGGSMEPFIKDGNVLEIAPVAEARVRRGDVLLVEAWDGKWLAHRVVKTGRRGGRRQFLIKGDACPFPDGWFGAERVLGRVVSLAIGSQRIDLSAGVSRLQASLWVILSPWTPKLSWLPKRSRRRLRRIFFSGLLPD